VEGKGWFKGWPKKRPLSSFHLEGIRGGENSRRGFQLKSKSTHAELNGESYNGGEGAGSASDHGGAAGLRRWQNKSERPKFGGRNTDGRYHTGVGESLFSFRGLQSRLHYQAREKQPEE